MQARQSQVQASQMPGEERLSALLDGEADADACTAVLRAWRQDPEVRADWHVYHLIGDVMRSEDLAQAGGHDARFLAAVCERLAAEPVVLAPAALPPASGRRAAVWRLRRWTAPAAMAAGVLSVAGVAIMMRGPVLPGEPAVATMASAVQPSVAAPASLVAQDVTAGALVRDPELDRYLDAHRQHGRGAALATPDGIRQVVSQQSVGR